MFNFYIIDNHIIVQALGRLAEKGINLKKKSLSALVHNKEKVRTLEYGCFNFIDSNAFLSTSLDKLVENLVLSGHSFPLLKASGLVKNNNQLQLLKQKVRKINKYIYIYKYVVFILGYLPLLISNLIKII